MNKIRKGDQVIVLTGRDKGKRGTVTQRVDEDRLLVEGVNVVKKHVQAEPDEGHDRRRRRQDLADPPVERCDLQCRHRQGRSRRHQAADRRTSKKVRVFKSSGERSASSFKRRRDQGVRGPSWLVCRQFYREKVVPDLIEKFGYKSVMQVPRITKITLNMGVSEAVSDKKVMDHAVSDLTKIAGQKPVVTKSQEGDRRLQDPRWGARSAAWSRCAACGCTNSSIAS